MKNLISLVLTAFLTQATVLAQSPIVPSDATKPVQQEQSVADTAESKLAGRDLKLVTGTPIEIESTYTISSLNLRPNDYISFRVLIPVKIDGVTVIQEKALVTGRVVEAKRGGHWGKAGRLSWTMVDVIAADGTRVPIQVQRDLLNGRDGIKGISHGGQVATEMVVFGAMMFIFAPIVLMSGFRRGDDAILPQGKRFIVFVQGDALVKVAPER